MLAADAEQLCGKRYQRHADRQGHRWGMIGSELGWHGGKAEKSFRRLKAHKQLPILRAALLRHQQALLGHQPIARKTLAA
jgi:hypothetical protein